VKFPIVNDFELPGKKMTFWKLKKEFVEERRIALQHYLQVDFFFKKRIKQK